VLADSRKASQAIRNHKANLLKLKCHKTSILLRKNLLLFKFNTEEDEKKAAQKSQKIFFILAAPGLAL
jgi:ATP-dependent Zn protease